MKPTCKNFIAPPAFATALVMLATLNPQFSSSHAAPLDTAFTYQGRLNSGNGPANGLYDLQFRLCDAALNGNQVAQPVTNAAVAVSNGLFTVTLNFGPGLYYDQALWLWVSVRTNGNGSFTDLTPRQPLTPAPFALYAPSAGTASTASVASSVASGSVSSAAIADGAIVAADLSYAVASNSFWRLNGNVGTSASQFLGTTDNQAVSFRVNNSRVLRLDPGSNGVPNILAGYELNRITAGIKGGTIAGGGGPSQWNAITNGDFGTIGGGYVNTVGASEATVAGGQNNSATGIKSAVGGGAFNRATQFGSTVAGGYNNYAAGNYTFVGGGTANTNGGGVSVIAGGTSNTNYGSYATIGGGRDNTAGNLSSTVPGGAENVASGSYTLAAGQRAKALHTGAFVWADFMDADFSSTGTNQFLIRASGGVGINTNNPNGAALNVNGTVRATAFQGSGAGLTGITASAFVDNSIDGAKLASDSASLAKVTGGDMSVNSGKLNLNDDLYLNDREIYLRSDSNHGLGWYGSGKLFDGANVNGPALYGNGGGVLGWRNGGTDHIVVAWDNAGNVGIGTASRPGRLNVSGTNEIATGVDGIANIGNSAAAHLTLDANKLQARNGASDTTLFLNRTGGNVAIGIGVSSNPAKLDVNGDTRVRGLLRSGAANTGETPSPEGLVVRRINTTQTTAGYVIAKARTDSGFGSSADITLERDNTAGGFLIRYPANPGNITIACMGMDSAGTQRNSYTTLANPATAGTVQIYANALNVVHFQCTFGVTYSSGQHLTHVTLSRFGSDSYWSGTLTSTYNQ